MPIERSSGKHVFGSEQPGRRLYSTSVGRRLQEEIAADATPEGAAHGSIAYGYSPVRGHVLATRLKGQHDGASVGWIFQCEVDPHGRTMVTANWAAVSDSWEIY